MATKPTVQLTTKKAPTKEAMQKAFANFLLDTDLTHEEGMRLLKVVVSEDFASYRHYTHAPVPVHTFIAHPEFMGASHVIYPPILKALVEVNDGTHYEAVLSGGIGSGKTTLALYIIAYQLYLLSCFKRPHEIFDLDPSSEIEFIFQSLSHGLAKEVGYDRFRSMIERSPYFRKHFMFRRDIVSKLEFPHRIIVKPVSGLSTAAIGQNVIGGLLDEVNYMAVTELTSSSAKTRGGKGKKEKYDQAAELYNSIARRRESRFTVDGLLYGILCLVSSRRYPGEFTDVKEQEAKTDKGIYVYSKRVWEIKPPGTYGDEFFTIFIGDDSRRPRILEDDEKPTKKDAHLFMRIPKFFKNKFERDLLESLREIAGVAIYAVHPFFMNTDAVSACFNSKVESIFSDFWTDFVTNKIKANVSHVDNLSLPRFVHIDLSRSKDSTGLCIGHCPGFVQMERGDYKEMLPKIFIDGILEIRPPPNEDILFWRVRKILYTLRTLGMNIKWVTVDTWQTDDTRQLLARKGFTVGVQSMDTEMEPWEMTKMAAYDGRIVAPKHSTVEREIKFVEYDPLKDKVDHPEGGSKDCLDALTGVVYGLSRRPQIWRMFGVPIRDISSREVPEAESAKK